MPSGAPAKDSDGDVLPVAGVPTGDCAALLEGGEHPLEDLEPQPARHERHGLRVGEVVEVGPVGSPDLQNVTEPPRRDQRGRHTPPFGDGVDDHRGPVDQRVDRGGRRQGHDGLGAVEHERGVGYPKERAAIMAKNRGILKQLKSASCKDMVTVLESVDQELVKAAVGGEKFKELFFANCQDDAIASYLKRLLASASEGATSSVFRTDTAGLQTRQ